MSRTSTCEARSVALRAGDFRVEVDGARPPRLREWRSPGENGVAIARARINGRAHLRVTSPDHWVHFSLGGATRIECSIADRRRLHTLRIGSMALLPAGADAVAETDGPVEQFMLKIAPYRITVAAAERGCPGAHLVERLSGSDDALLRLAASLFAEAHAGYVNGPLFWNETADRIIDGLIDNHLSRGVPARVGALSPVHVARLVDFIRAHVADPLDIASLATVAGLSPYHFTRAFTRSVGMTPHRYVTKLRLDEAVALMRQRRLPLAEIALATGFADQSHLSRWVRRVYGTTPLRLAA